MRNGLTLAHSSGAVEGGVNRIKIRSSDRCTAAPGSTCSESGVLLAIRRHRQGRVNNDHEMWARSSSECYGRLLAVWTGACHTCKRTFHDTT